ncbi:MAG: RNA polymerase factor sigma-32 [Deltaproteobacteria bacterium]|nr:RNA polymerase factor sigma-32 [Deltaproteobacteria bacterium]
MALQSHNEPLSAYMSDVHRTDLLDREQEAELARQWCATRDESAAEELVQRNLRFVVKVAMGYRKYGVPVTDLIQEGNMGLMHAVEKFDPNRGTRLISYAVWWIKAYIQSYIIRSWSLVRVGTTQTQRRLFYKLPRALSAPRVPGESPDARIERIAEELNARPKDVTLMMGALKGRDLSLDVPVEASSNVTWGDRVRDEGMNPEQATAETEDEALRHRLLKECVGKLSARQQEIMRLRHMIDEPMTLRQVGTAMGLSRERVRQLEHQALRKLKGMMVPRYERGANQAPRAMSRAASRRSMTA